MKYDNKQIADEPWELVRETIDFITELGEVDGAHHKQWVIDQMLRKLAGEEHIYQEIIATIKNGEDGPDTYGWSEGMAP